MPESEPASAPHDRSLGAFVIGGAAGVLVFAAMLAGAVLLYQRLYGDSLPALIILLAVFGGLGAYLAWLVGVLIFSRVRRPGNGEIG
jgi:hypothetical protein